MTDTHTDRKTHRHKHIQTETHTDSNNRLIITGPVTKTKNIKTDSTKILRPTGFLRPKDIKTDKFFSVLFPVLFKDGE